MTKKIIELAEALTPFLVLGAILVTGLVFIKYFERKEKRKRAKFPDFPTAEKPPRNWRDSIIEKK